MLQLLNSANFLFQIFNAIGQVLLNFQNFYVLLYTYSLPVINLTRTLVGFPMLKALPVFPRPFLTGWVWGPD